MTKRDFILVTSDTETARAICELVQRYAGSRHVHTSPELASELAPGTHWAGLVFDLDGFDADPLATMAQLRMSHPLLPVLAITSRTTPQLVNALHLHRAE